MRSIRLWASILVSGLFLWLAFRGQDLAATGRAIRSAEYIYLLPAVALYFAGVWVRAARWRVLLSPFGRFSTRALFPVVTIGYMANDVLPARMGEVVRVYVLSQRERLSKTSALGTVVVERLFDAVTMLGLLAAGAAVVPLDDGVRQVGLVAVILLGVAALPVTVAALRPELLIAVARPAVALIPVSISGRLAHAGGGFVAGLGVLRRPRVLAGGLLLSLTAWTLEAGMYWVLSLGFDLHVSPAVIVLTLAVANLATLVPAAPGYVGSFEVGGLLVLAGLAGLNRETATAYVVVLHAALVIPVTLLGFYYWGHHHLTLGAIRRSSESTDLDHEGGQRDDQSKHGLELSAVD